MASAHPYAGPMSLENSKHATPITKKASLVSSMASQSMIASPRTETALTTNCPTTQMTSQRNSDTQLAISHGMALKEEVDKHATRFSVAASTAVTNTRRLLELIREALPDSTRAHADAMSKELEQLYVAVNDAKAALPIFLEKQRNNISLYHTSMMNRMVQDTQHELNIQHNKTNLQHSLILEHQEAFSMYKEQTDTKLKDLVALNERVSRLTLEKGNLRTEVDKYAQLLEEERSVKEGGLAKVGALQNEIEMLKDSNKQLLVEIDTLRKTKDDRSDEARGVEQETERRFAAELKSLNDKLAEQTEKMTALQTMVANLEDSERIAKLEAENAKMENKALGEKSDVQAAEHAKLFKQLNEHIKEINDLQANAALLQRQKAELQHRVDKLADVETQLAQLTKANSGLSENVSSLTSELNATRDEATKAKTEREALLKRVESLSKDTEHVDPDASRLVGEQAQKIASLEVLVQEWTDLAKRSYQEYKEILPLSKQAEQFREDLVQKEEAIKDLQEKLALAKGSQSGDEAHYWRTKYENLLESYSK
ncbi:hypothetical protein yc1106_05459 [Curvularia clavata]|uniref:Uncharacterized protein n=1 Tax=Curvularia clavata TaxID=95742 RepID=A0A9Q8ZAJ2_CURCL|nr:hypothetical protein yc1106_05459 [Curvularia clavata]